MLLFLIEKHGTRCWKKLADKLLKKIRVSRTSKQCRDRWINKLKVGPSSNQIPFNEKNKVIKLVLTIGPLWSRLSTELGTMTENQIKNFINSSLRRNIRRFNKNRPCQDKINTNSLELLNIPELQKILLLDRSAKAEFFDRIEISNTTKVLIQNIAEGKSVCQAIENGLDFINFIIEGDLDLNTMSENAQEYGDVDSIDDFFFSEVNT